MPGKSSENQPLPDWEHITETLIEASSWIGVEI